MTLVMKTVINFNLRMGLLKTELQLVILNGSHWDYCVERLLCVDGGELEMS